MVTKKKKKTSKKAPKTRLKNFPWGGAKAFIRNFGVKVPAADVVAAANAKGFKLEASQVYNERQSMKKDEKLDSIIGDANELNEDLHQETILHALTKESAAGSYKSGYRDGYGDGYEAGLRARK